MISSPILWKVNRTHVWLTIIFKNILYLMLKEIHTGLEQLEGK